MNNVKHITVEYPTEKVTIIPKTKAEMDRERFNPWHKGEVKDHYRIVTKVNEEQKIYVRRTERVIQEMFMTNDDYALEQTGMTPAAYQAKHGRAWND